MSLTETLLQSAPQKFGLWPSVWKLLRLRVRIWWNGLRRAKLRSKIGTGVIVFLVLALMVGLFFGSALLLRLLQSPRLAELVNPTEFLKAIPTLVLTMAFFLTLMTNFGVLLQSLYLSRDMDFLVTTPLPMRAVFLAKLLEAILPNFALFCAFSLPVLFGMGIGSGYNLLYYPFLVLMLALLALAAGGMASILVMAIVRVVPAKRVAEVLGVAGAMASILCGQSGNLINAMGVSKTEVSSALNLFTQLNTPWSPLAWAGNGLTAIGQGSWVSGLALSSLSLALAGAIFAGTLFLAEQLYYTGWASMQGSIRKKRPNRAAKPTLSATAPTALGAALSGGSILSGGTPSSPVSPLAPASNIVTTSTLRPAPGRALRLIPAQMRGMILKDFLLLRRDPRNFSQMITPLILGVVMLFTTGGRGRGNPTAALARTGIVDVERYFMIALAVFVGWMLMFNLATVAFSREGRSYWLLKTAPISGLNLLISKFIVSYLPSALFSLVYLLGAFLIRAVPLHYYVYSAWIIALIMAGSTGIALAFGTAGANLEWDRPQHQRLSGAAGCLSFIIVAAFMVIDLAFFIAPPVLWQILSGSTPFLAYLVSFILGTSASLLAVILPLWYVVPKVGRIGEA